MQTRLRPMGLRWALLVALAAHVAVAQAGPARRGPPHIESKAVDAYVQKQLAEEKYPSLSVGVVHDQELVFAKAYGVADRKTGRSATPETIYRIGSVTKVFTTTLLAILRDKGVVRLDDPIAKYLPADLKLPTDRRGAPAITLRHLATQTSGLPRIPFNLVSKNGDAYGGYTVEQLYEALGKMILDNPIGAKYSYSNLGVGLLGHVLEGAAGKTYEQLLREHLLEPVGMHNTAIRLSPEQQAVYATGYRGDDMTEEAPEWDLGSLAGCGALASSVTDLAKFLSLQMRAGEAGVEPVSGGTLTELHAVQRLTEGWSGGIGLGWQVTPLEGIDDVVWHNGGVAGHFAFIGFLPRRKIGVIVLANGFKPVDLIAGTLLVMVAEPKAAATQTAPATQAAVPSAEEILERYVEVTGGREAHERIRTYINRGTATLMGATMTIEELGALPDKYRLRMQAGEAVITEQGHDGQVVWKIELGQPSIVKGEEREQFLREARLDADLNWRELYTHAACAGIAPFEGHTCYKVGMTADDGDEETRYYDVGSGLLIGKESRVLVPPFGKMDQTEIYSEYKRFGEFLHATRIVFKSPLIETTITIDSVEVNADIPPERFEPPPAIRRLLDKQTATQPSSRPAATMPVDLPRR